MARADRARGRAPDAGDRPLLLRVGLLPRAERHPLRARDRRRRGVHRGRAARAPRRAPVAPAGLRASARPGRAQPPAASRHAPLACRARRGPPRDLVAFGAMISADVDASAPGIDAESARARVRTASFSVAAACFLVAVKLGAGLVTGSLGLLAEAAHSGTDLVAALLTLFALRVAVRPADETHQYGHGKAEHLAALGESAFLALVSAFIGYEALQRLLDARPHPVDAQWWAL